MNLEVKNGKKNNMGIEKPTNNKAEQKRTPEEEFFERLLEKIGKQSESLRKMGLPIGPNLRINPRDYSDVYSKEKIESDLIATEGVMEKIHEKKLSLKEIEKEKLKTDGAKLEILVSLLLNKFFEEYSKGRFVAVGTSDYDDLKNGLDTVIFDTLTGRIICAIDEVADNEGTGRRIEEKIKKFTEKNELGGRKLEYGLDVENGKIRKTKRENIPIVLLSLKSKEIKIGFERMLFEKDEKKRNEMAKGFFNYFIKAIGEQIEGLERDKYAMRNPFLKQNLENFKKTMDELAPEEDGFISGKKKKKRGGN